MPAAKRLGALRLTLPYDLAGPRIEREHHVADVAGFARQLDIARDHALVDLVFRQALLDQLGDVVVAENARRRSFERAGTDRGGDEHAIPPHDRRRPSAT